jgi:exodeoxyribonuclease V alpha subunit
MSLLAALHLGGWLRAVDHALGLSLRHAREDTPDWVQAAAALASRALALGHSRLPLDRLDLFFAGIDPTREPPTMPPRAEWLAVLAASPWVQAGRSGDDRSPAPRDRVLVLEGEAIALRRYHDYEVRLAEALLVRMRADEAGNGARLQLVTGGPGTGKTTRVARLLAEFAEAHAARGLPPPRILLAAPTGKAASRLSESVRDTLAREVQAGRLAAESAALLPTVASTLHRLLGWQRDGGFRHDAAHPLAADLVVVDEASMIDLPLMCKLAEAVPADATLVLVGDRDQLPSVDTGDVLAALCEASERPGAQLAAHRIHLTESHRQASELEVGELAALVRAGQADKALAGLEAGRFRGVRWRRSGDKALHDAVLAEALPAYRALAEAPDVASALQAARALRILCAVREGPAGSHTLNALIGRALDPLHGGAAWFPGRLVLVTANSYRQQLFNGDIGIAWPDAAGEIRVWFESDAGPKAWLPAALPAHEPAWALTVHKAQGSEFDRVLLALPEHGARVLSRELLYTGLTRCRRELLLWADADALRAAIDRRALRWSGVAARLGADGAAAADAAVPADSAPADATPPPSAVQGTLF